MRRIARALAIVIGVAGLAAQASAQTFTATASVKSPSGNASAPVTIKVDKFVSDADREKLIGVIKGGDAAATRKALAAMEDIGYVELKSQRTPIKYAYARSTGSGRLITVVTAAPIHYVGGTAADAKAKGGFDLGLALLVLDGSDKGDGEMAPAAKVKVDDAGAIVTEDYGKEHVRLTGVAKKDTGTKH
jgi:hypothetical protein